MAENRYIGKYPVIGIRPVIDARRGYLNVRGSLEEQTMNMASFAKKLFEENLRYSNGESVKVVISPTTIGRVAEAAECADFFESEGVAITLTVTPCWCYGAETMDMSPNTIKGVWGFNGTERPGAVYLASVLATHAQKGLPAFGIYGHDVQEADAVEIPEDVQEKLLRFGRAAVAVATMRGKSYLQIGSICMGIGGSIIDPAFIEEYLGMRVESVDEVEILRRIQQDIYDKDEFEKAYKWTREHCPDGLDKNPAEIRKTPEEKEEDWKFVVKTMCIIKDLMNGNDRLPAGREEEMVGHNAIAAGFQGQRQWTDYYPNTDFAEAMLNTTFDWNGAREPYILATENDVLNGLGMLFLKLLTNRAQIFADVRTYFEVFHRRVCAAVFAPGAGVCQSVHVRQERNFLYPQRIDNDMHMDIAAVVVSVRVGADNGLVSGKLLPAKFLAQRLRPVYGQTVVHRVPWVKADNVVVAFYIFPLLVLPIAEIGAHTGNGKILVAAVQRGYSIVLPEHEPPVFIKGGLHGKLVMFKGEVLLGCAIIRIFRADMFECCQQRHLPFAGLQTSRQQGQKWRRGLQRTGRCMVCRTR